MPTWWWWKGSCPLPKTLRPPAGTRNFSRTLSAEVILVLGCSGLAAEQLDQDLEYAASLYGGVDDPRLVGCILNRVIPLKDEPVDQLCMRYSAELRAAQTRTSR